MQNYDVALGSLILTYRIGKRHIEMYSFGINLCGPNKQCDGYFPGISHAIMNSWSDYVEYLIIERLCRNQLHTADDMCRRSTSLLNKQTSVINAENGCVENVPGRGVV